MLKKSIKLTASIALLLVGLLVMSVPIAGAGGLAQQPTVDIATVTGTPEGPMLRVNSDNRQINVRSGPGTDYAPVGLLVAGQIVPAYGKSAGGAWIQVYYPGVPGDRAWVYAPLVTLIRGGELLVLDKPPTPTPRISPTLDPTLEAEFIVAAQATRLPTFTPPPPLVVPTLPPVVEPTLASSFPMGLVIVTFGVIGVLGALMSFLRGR